MSRSLHSPPVANVPFSRPGTPGLRPTHVAFVGLGSIGYLMARNLAINRHTHPAGNPPLLVWNRTAAKSEALVKEVGANRAIVAASLEQVVNESDIIITCLADDDVVKAIYEQFAKLIISAPSKKRIFVESSTIFPTLAGELDSLISSAPHAHLLTCPVFGAHSVAATAQLLILMSGDYHSKKEVAYLLVPAVGRKVIDLGENIEKAPTLKLLGNSLILGTIEVLAEAQTLGEKSGIEGKTLHEVVQEILPAPGVIAYSQKMINDDFDGTKGFALDGGIKDASHIRRLTAKHNSPMPVIDIAHQHLITTRAIHSSLHQEGQASHDVLDWSGIVAASRVSAGLDAFDRKKVSATASGC
ncbi:NAD-P-binding protein [Pluteus cervinus]|uniref:NAD-P-binding protein n=1 Tax=Pluteus cervinus TaxID=181527 RepID=A0ACD3BHS5_9AGAR|nr:NAD-P-binding protein [Pluteus cervinus]